MRRLEWQRSVDPALAQHGLGVRPARGAQRGIDELHLGHVEAAMFRAQPHRQPLQHRVVGAALARRLDQLRADLEVGVAAGLVQVVVFHEHRCRQHHVGPASRLCHELFVHADEQIVTREPAAHAVAVRAHRQRILVLDQQGVHLRPITQLCPISRQHAADPAHVQLADRGVACVQPFDQRLVDMVHAAVRPQRTAALVLPGAGDGGQAGHRVHVRRAVAAAREAVAAADVAALRAAIQRGEILDQLRRQAGDRRRPRRATRAQMRFQRVRHHRRSAPCRRGRRSRRGRRRASRRRPARRRCQGAARGAGPLPPRSASDTDRPPPASRHAPFARA